MHMDVQHFFLQAIQSEEHLRKLAERQIGRTASEISEIEKRQQEFEEKVHYTLFGS